MADFLPRRESALLNWTRVFAKQLTHQADPGELGLTAEQVAAYSEAQAAFAEALRAAKDPRTRGLYTVRIKDEKRKAVVALTRELGRIIRAQPGVGSVERIKLGLVPRTRTLDGPTPNVISGVDDQTLLPTGLPVKGPRVTVRADSPRVEVSLRTFEGKRARPTAAVGAAVYWAVGQTAPTSFAGYTLAGNTTKPQMNFVLPSGTEPGTKVWVTASWLDSRLQPGPAGEPETAQVGFGFLLTRQAA